MPKTRPPAEKMPGRRPRAAPPAAADAAIDAWAAAFLEREPPRSKSLVATVIGDAIAPHGGEIWMAALIALLAPFGFSDRLVRTSVFRLAEEGLLESRRDGRRALYVLTDRGRQRFISAQRRIYMPPAQRWNGQWTLVMTPRTGSGDVDRSELRRELAWLGFAAIGQGILAHPAADLTALREALEGQNLLDRVHVLQAADIGHFGALPTREIVAYTWNLDTVAASYRHFNQIFRPLVEKMGAQPVVAPLQAFRLRTLLIHAYRRAILQDPQFPADLLPADWPGHEAYGICNDLYNVCCRPAERHLAHALDLDLERPQPAEHYFYLRFGGLVA